MHTGLWVYLSHEGIDFILVEESNYKEFDLVLGINSVLNCTGIHYGVRYLFIPTCMGSDTYLFQQVVHIFQTQILIFL